nr:PREDICTED: uncharacterized protein LOC107398289 [Tribolium castaneum]|eukprot:XP_015837391.1 PREDICTED: uncharacterized protein LOC107398289 [Tribolium castaneum]
MFHIVNAGGDSTLNAITDVSPHSRPCITPCIQKCIMHRNLDDSYPNNTGGGVCARMSVAVEICARFGGGFSKPLSFRFLIKGILQFIRKEGALKGRSFNEILN